MWRRLGQIQPLGPFTGTVSLSLFGELLFEGRVGRLFRYLLKLERVLQILGNHHECTL
jgi:hypothetical protein